MFIAQQQTSDFDSILKHLYHLHPSVLLLQAMETMLAQILERLTASQLKDWGLDSACNTSRKCTEVTRQASFMMSIPLLAWHIMLQLSDGLVEDGILICRVC